MQEKGGNEGGPSTEAELDQAADELLRAIQQEEYEEEDGEYESPSSDEGWHPQRERVELLLAIEKIQNLLIDKGGDGERTFRDFPMEPPQHWTSPSTSPAKILRDTPYDSIYGEHQMDVQQWRMVCSATKAILQRVARDVPGLGVAEREALETCARQQEQMRARICFYLREPPH